MKIPAVGLQFFQAAAGLPDKGVKLSFYRNVPSNRAGARLLTGFD
ncbi:Hypothetical protein BROD_1173 [Brucella sp. NF 2653]|uniref:Uncharacterized protein n=2 Tax=Brucella TaxID=234 RepID=C0RIX5_BRUMB|nr:Hypothetical protein, conserved [Brucella melitensis ATCC 23457]EEH14526.1 Hypothetical protein, conserved [Brucella ceti str. Cudo]EFM57353.1 Hypothetical protein BIBO1_0536 [Brucella inopinata BO1]EFM62733.1 Hypothetical protein BROD_1173 [Brucella sp. NF 2653]